MLNAFLFGLLATLSLMVGGLIATRFNLPKRTLGIIMAFGSGTLIPAESYELTNKAVKLGNGSGFSSMGFFAGGAILMVLANFMIPDAYEQGGKVTGIVMVFGFFVSVVML